MENTVRLTHEQLIAKCFQWHWNEFPEERRMLFGVNNNSWNRQEGNMNKAKGVVPGVFDFTYILPDRIAFLDAKVGKDRLSFEQLDFQEKARGRGAYTNTFSTLEEFQHIILSLQHETAERRRTKSGV